MIIKKPVFDLLKYEPTCNNTKCTGKKEERKTVFRESNIAQPEWLNVIHDNVYETDQISKNDSSSDSASNKEEDYFRKHEDFSNTSSDEDQEAINFAEATQILYKKDSNEENLLAKKLKTIREQDSDNEESFIEGFNSTENNQQNNLKNNYETDLNIESPFKKINGTNRAKQIQKTKKSGCCGSFTKRVFPQDKSDCDKNENIIYPEKNILNKS